MSRITLFAKGNLDVRDTLQVQRLGGAVTWNGVNELLRDRAVTARVRHETFGRSDALLAADGVIPAAFEGRDLPLEAYTLASQFAPRLFEAEADVVAFSIQPDMNSYLVRHRTEGFLFYPYGWDAWPQADQTWLRANFELLPLLDVDASMANFEAIIERLRARSPAHILIYNLSATVPGEHVHDHLGMQDLLSTRIRRFNLGLIELSQQTGVSIIDVDTIVAREGAERMKLDTLHLTASGARAVTEEVVRVLDDLGVLAPQDAA